MNIFKWVIDYFKKLGSRFRKKGQEGIIRERVRASRNTTKSEIERKFGELLATTNPLQVEALAEIIKEQTAFDLGKNFDESIANHRFSKRGFDLVEVEQEIYNLNLKLFEIELRKSRIDPVLSPRSYPTDKEIVALERLFKEHDSKQNLTFSTDAIGKLKSRFGEFDKYLQERLLIRIYRRREEKRLQEEDIKRQQVKELIGRIENLINHGDLPEAKNQIAKATSIITALRNPKEKKFFHNKLETLKAKFREIQIREEAKRQAEELKKRQEEAECRRIADEAKREEERKQRDQQVLIQRQQEETIRRKKEEKKHEKERLLTKKSNWHEFAEVFRENNITKFYHFTDRSNIPSIKNEGGLYSWHYCDHNNIEIPKTGGAPLSRGLDKSHGLHDFVRLSFCLDHPMQYRLSQSGYNLVLLEVSIEVAFFENTRFADINATDNGHHQGALVEDLKRIKFSATKRNYLSRNDPDFKFHQAEVMIKTWIPIEYITNINQF